MLDQMFTAENFRRIFDLENRKGNDLASRFFAELEIPTYNIKAAVEDIRSLRKENATTPIDDFDVQIAVLKTELAKRKFEKSIAIDAAMDRISKNVQKSDFSISLTEKSGPENKPIFCIDESPETFFVIKQLQHNLNKIYKVKQANRHDISCQIRDTLSTDFPLEIIRTDISSFYESVDRKKLLTKLDSDQLLSSSSKRFIQQILRNYGKLSGSLIGIPRGVGISAYLAELYLRPVDQKIKELPGIVLYCRFVDDIVAVFARPPSSFIPLSYKDKICEELAKEGLTNNPNKTDEILLGSSPKKALEYLGYSFTPAIGACSIKLSEKKILRYQARMEAAFATYDADSKRNYRRAYRELVARVKFLTGNTRLVNSKSTAVTGIYFNNSIANDLSQLTELDSNLKKKIATVKRKSLRERLKPFRFESGFSNRRFHHFNARELQTIVKAWKHV